MKTREEWLKDLAEMMMDAFNIRPTTKWAVSCGWPKGSRGGNKAIGQCWDPVMSDGAVAEMFISPTLSAAREVAHVLAHEIVHAFVGTEEGHKGEFKTVARRIGLEGKLTATHGGEEFYQVVDPFLKTLGGYPHSAMKNQKRGKGKKGPGSRLIKAFCPCCGYTVRLSQKWIDVAFPVCPNEDCEEFQNDMVIE